MKLVSKKVNLLLGKNKRIYTIHRKKNNRLIETQNYVQTHIYAVQIRTSNYNVLLIRLVKNRKTNKTQHWWGLEKMYTIFPVSEKCKLVPLFLEGNIYIYWSFQWAYPWNQQVHFRFLFYWKTTIIFYKVPVIEVLRLSAYCVKSVGETNLCSPRFLKKLMRCNFERTKLTLRKTPQDFSPKTFEYPITKMHLTKILIRTLKLIKLFLNRIFPLSVVTKRKFIFPAVPGRAGIWYNWKSF